MTEVDSPSAFTEHGPFSVRSAREEEQPGPPVSHITSGVSSEETSSEDDSAALDSWFDSEEDSAGASLGSSSGQLKMQGQVHSDSSEGPCFLPGVTWLVVRIELASLDYV